MGEERLTLEEVYEGYRPKVLRYLTGLVGVEEAEDLTQDVFIKVGQALADFRGESSLPTWLYRIATNTAIDRMRSPAFKRQAQDLLAMENEEEGAELDERDAWTGEKLPTVEQQLVQKYMTECFLGFVKKLPEGYRTVFVLSQLESFSNPEIAEILGVSLDTVKIRLHRARARLREDLETKCEYYWTEELSWPADQGDKA